MKTNSGPATPNGDGTFDAVFMASQIEFVEPELSPATVNIKRFLDNPVLLFQHFVGDVIGCVTDIVRRGGKIRGKIKFAEDEFSQMVREKWEAGMIRACSMGLTYRNDTWELVEVSIVAIPRDPAAVRNELNAARLTRHQGEGEQKENNAVGASEAAGLRILTIQEREANSQTSPSKTMAENNTQNTEPTVQAAEPAVTPEPQAQAAPAPEPTAPEFRLSVEELRTTYAELIPAEFAGETAKAVLAEASRLNPETHSLEYMSAIADTRLAARKEAKTVKHVTATTTAAVSARVYTLSEIHNMESRDNRRA